jgi:hypothetical protein
MLLLVVLNQHASYLFHKLARARDHVLILSYTTFAGPTTESEASGNDDDVAMEAVPGWSERACVHTSKHDFSVPTTKSRAGATMMM